jgi:hypothetical protein
VRDLAFARKPAVFLMQGLRPAMIQEIVLVTPKFAFEPKGGATACRQIPE